MAMQFWEAKRKRRLRTFLYLSIFFILSIAASYAFELAVRYFAQEGYTPPMPYLGLILFGFILIVSFFYYLSYASRGGAVVAEAMGGKEITSLGASPKELQLLNIVEEIAIASRLPMPKVYLIKAQEINAFAAGLTSEKAVIVVTVGALNLLNREELQGVIAHEFGHIASEDMKMSMRLSAMLMGFFIIFYIAIRIMEGSLLFGRGSDRKGSSITLIALLLLVFGAFLWFAGAILRACISREREYLADASAVEFTRNPHGISGALRKIEEVNNQVRDMPKSGFAYSHLYLDNRNFWSRLFATHPPIEKRIAALEGDEKKKGAL